MRALAMRHSAVPTGDRDAFRARAREAQAQYTGAGCRYWVYEDAELPGAYVEFFEAESKEMLEKANSGAKQPPSRMYLEVDLT